MSVALLCVVFEIARVLVFLCVRNLSPVSVLHVLKKLSLVNEALIGRNKFAYSMESIIFKIAFILPTIKLPKHTFSIGHIIAPLSLIKSAIGP